MSLRYTQGAGRRGERAEQLGVRTRLVNAIRRALAARGGSLEGLPRNTDDWEVLAAAAPRFEC